MLFADVGFCGFDCGEGWRGVLERLVDRVAPEMIRIGAVIDQVKEKFGGLRFYVSHENDAIRDAISEAEREALKTCETCGSKENVKTKGEAPVVRAGLISSPTTWVQLPGRLPKKEKRHRGVAQLAGALGSGPRGRWLKSSRRDHRAIAQLGSAPVWGTGGRQFKSD